MKILYFYQYFGTPRGGWSTRVYEFTRRWVSAGHRVTVVTSPYDKSDIPAGKRLVSTLMIDGIEVIVINIKQSNKHPLLYRFLTFSAFSVLGVYYSLRLKYDILIASSGPITIGFPALAAKYLRRKKIIFEVRDLWPEGAIQLNLLNNRYLQRLAYWFEKKCYFAAHTIVTCSKGMSQSILRRFDLSNVYEVPNSSDNKLFDHPISNFHLPPWAINKKIFIYTGSLGLMDDCIQILEAAKELKQRGRQDILIVIAGNGQESEYLREYAHVNKLEQVRFLGLIPKRDVVNWLNAAHAGLLVFKNVSVLDTSSPNKLFDYMAAALPVIQTTSGWIKDLISDHKFGVNTPPDDAPGMADAIVLLADNDELRARLAKNSKLLAVEVFSRDILAEKYLNIINSVNSR